MWRYVLKRVAMAAPLVLVVVTINFVLIQAAPGDPVDVLVGEWPAPQEYRDQLRRDLGLDRSVPERYVAYLASVATGDFGFSFKNRQPVAELILQRMPATLLLMVTSMLLAAVLGVTLGVIASLRPYSTADNLISVVALVGYSMPVFWLGQILLVTFGVELGLLPIQGMTSVTRASSPLDQALDVARHLVLPVAALALRYLAVNTRVTRASMHEVYQRDFITTARAKGLPERTVVMRHTLRNALLPVVTILGFNFGYILTGSVLVETVFGWPGIGLLLFDSLAARDHQVILGIFVVGALTAIVANLITDVLYAALDPRIRYG